MKAIPRADRNTWFCEAGIIAMRNPDGTMQPAVPLFLAVDAAEVNSDGTTRSESELCEDIGRYLAKKFCAYMRTMHGIESLTKQEE